MRTDVEVIRDVARLEELVPQWGELAAGALEPNPSYESWMLLPALRSLGAGAEVDCVVVWAQRASAAPRKLAALFPFERAASLRGLPARALRSWCHPSFVLGTPLVRADSAKASLRALLDWAGGGGDGAAAVEFRYLPADGPFHEYLTGALRDRDMNMIATTAFSRALLRKAESAERYLERALSRDSRKSLRRKERRLQEMGAVAHVAMKPDDDPGPWIEAMLALEASGWKGRKGSALASTPAERRFAVEVMTAAHARGRLQILGVDLDGRPVSRCCNFLAGDGAYAWRTAYDEQFASCSPGIMAEVDTIRAFHETPGLQWMDSITDPNNETLNRLWIDRRTISSVVVGARAWGEIWVSLLPVLRWAKHKLRIKGPWKTILAAGGLGLALAEQ